MKEGNASKKCEYVKCVLCYNKVSDDVFKNKTDGRVTTALKAIVNFTVTEVLQLISHVCINSLD